MESATIAVRDPQGAAAGEKGLKTGALGYLSNLVISPASMAPAYSLAATLRRKVYFPAMYASAAMTTTSETMIAQPVSQPSRGSVARATHARMTVVGSHGESPLKGAIIGATPYKLVQISEVPVLVVRP